MAKFGQFKFSEAQFGTKYVPDEFKNRTYRTYPLGKWVMGSINKEVTYRVRTGNNNYGAPLGMPIQDKYNYFLATGYETANVGAARDAFVTAYYNWKNVLTDEQKKEYNDRAAAGLHMSGCNLYVGEYIQAHV